MTRRAERLDNDPHPSRLEEAVKTMRMAEPPALDSPRRGHSGDDLDGLLRSYFRAQMPEPWPALELPAEETILPLPATTRIPRWKTFRTRLALAASVAFLLAGAWLIGGSLPTGAPRERVTSGSGDVGDAKGLPRRSKEPPILDERLKLDQGKKTKVEWDFDNDGLPQ